MSEEAQKHRNSDVETSEGGTTTQKSYFPVQLDSQTERLFQHKYSDVENNLNEYLFIEVYAFVLDRLREYFQSFKNSQDFVRLEEEITQQERLYEVLVEANLIDQN